MNDPYKIIGVPRDASPDNELADFVKRCSTRSRNEVRRRKAKAD